MCVHFEFLYYNIYYVFLAEEYIDSINFENYWLESKHSLYCVWLDNILCVTLNLSGLTHRHDIEGS